MRFTALPSQASWRHVGAREGFEVCWPVSVGDVHRWRGVSTGIADGTGWSVSYDVEVGPDGRTRVAVVRTSGRDGQGEVLLERDDDDRWSVDGLYLPELDGVADVDLEASVVTTTLPLRRLDLRVGHATQVDAVLVRLDLRVQRISQTYEPVGRTDGELTVAHTSSTSDVACTLRLDASSGLVVDHPGLARRSTVPPRGS